MKHKALFILFCLIVAVSSLPASSIAALSALDGFDPDVDGDVLAIAIQPDGKIIIGGQFDSVGGTQRFNIARLNTDGSLDVDFDPFANLAVTAIAIQTDGKILLGGIFIAVNGSNRSHIARLNEDGSLDKAFYPSIGPVLAAVTVDSIVTQPNGKILIGGRFTSVNGINQNHVARLNEDGSLDITFNPVVGPPPGGGLPPRVSVVALALQSNGKIILGGEFGSVNGISRDNLARLNPDGSLDPAFNPSTDDSVTSVICRVDGKIWIGGVFSNIDGTARVGLALLESSGSVDTSFDPFVLGYVITMELQQDGKLLIGGFLTAVAGEARHNIARFNPDGSLDMDFSPNVSGLVRQLAIQPNGKVLLGGGFTSVNSVSRKSLARLNSDNSLDIDFVANASHTVLALAIQPDGKLLAGGVMTSIHNPQQQVQRDYLFRLNGDGSIDTDFLAPPMPQPNNHVYAVTVQADGKILVGGLFTQFGGVTQNHLARLNQDGSLDLAFTADTNNPVRAIVLQPDGKIIIGGAFTHVNNTPRTRLARLNADGSLDADFNPYVDSVVTSLALQSNGSIVLGGVFTDVESQPRGKLARLNKNGSLDMEFKPHANNTVSAVALQADDRILVGGIFTEINGTQRNRIARLDRDGSLDSLFDPNADGAVASILLQADQKIIIGGAFTHFLQSTINITRNRIARLNSNGGVDRTFHLDVNDVVHCLALQSDGKIVLGGDFSTIDNVLQRSRLARFTATEAAIQSLSVAADGTSVIWLRGGTGPELERVIFEFSEDTNTWFPPHRATRIQGGWRLTGTTIPLKQYRYIRTRGSYPSGTLNGSGSIAESNWQVYRQPYIPPISDTFPWPLFLPAIIGGVQ